MQWLLKSGDILNEPADVLICSANVYLNLSGGVGGAMLLRYGDAMQKELHKLVAEQGRKFVYQGDVITTSACGTPYRAVLHAVAVDGFYRSSVAIVRAITEKGLLIAAGLGAECVALTALATGYGPLTMQDFGQAISTVLKKEFHPIRRIVICVRNEDDKDQLSSVLHGSAMREVS